MENTDVLDDDDCAEPNEPIVHGKVGYVKANLCHFGIKWQRNGHEVEQKVGHTDQEKVGFEELYDELVQEDLFSKGLIEEVGTYYEAEKPRGQTCDD